MCGRYTQTFEISKLKPRFLIDEVRGEIVPRYNVAPSQEVPAVLLEGGHRVLDPLRWGLIPVWTKTLKGAPRPINARAETVTTSGMFKRLLATHRCLVLADSFYEWMGDKTDRRPVRMQLKDGAPFAFAGLWDVWRDPAAGPDAPWIRTCTVLTTSANPLVAHVHDRMPVILAPELEAAWLDPELKDPAALTRMLLPLPADRMIATPVSPAVNNARFDEAECIRPVGPPLPAP